MTTLDGEGLVVNRLKDVITKDNKVRESITNEQPVDGMLDKRESTSNGLACKKTLESPCIMVCNYSGIQNQSTSVCFSSLGRSVDGDLTDLLSALLVAPIIRQFHYRSIHYSFQVRIVNDQLQATGCVN